MRRVNARATRVREKEVSHRRRKGGSLSRSHSFRRKHNIFLIISTEVFEEGFMEPLLLNSLKEKERRGIYLLALSFS